MTDFEPWIARALSFAAALVIIIIAEPRINSIKNPARRTGFKAVITAIKRFLYIAIPGERIDSVAKPVRLGFRLGFVLLTVAGVWTIIDLLSGDVPPWSSVMLRAGIALLLLEERHCPRSCDRSGVKVPAPITRHSRDSREASLPTGLRRTD